MKFPEDIRSLLERRFQRKSCDWLIASLTENSCITEIALGVPTEQTALKQINAIRAWVTAWQSWQGVGKLSWCKRRWQTLGVQQLPEKLILHGSTEIVAWIGQTARWSLAHSRYRLMVANWPVFTTYLTRYFTVLADYNETDFQCLFALLTWFAKHPSSNLYPRQLPVIGVHSKWLETHKGLLTRLVAILQGNVAQGLNFYQRCGLKALPALVRMRILDHELRLQLGGLGDITAPLPELAQLQLAPKNVLIVENLQTGLAVPDLPRTIVLIRLGNNVKALAQLPWLKQANCIYWGDLDTYGFAILNQARSYLPELQAIMMDETVLLQHRTLWVQEKKQNAAKKLLLLHQAEQTLYRKLKQHYWGHNIRLEQERIAWDFVLEKLQSMTW